MSQCGSSKRPWLGVHRVYAVALDRITRTLRDAIVLMDEFDRARATDTRAMMLRG